MRWKIFSTGLSRLTIILFVYSCCIKEKHNNGILLPKLFWPTVRKNCSSDREKLLKFEAAGIQISVNKSNEKNK